MMSDEGRKMWAGGCQCGAVRYELREPQWATVCHCRMCQRASGQPFMAFAGGQAENVRWTRGAPAVFRSSDLAERGFCAACGTPLTYARPAAGTLSITIGSLDDPSALAPTLQNGIESKLPWLDDLAAVPAQRTEAWLARIGVGAITVHQHADGGER
jgi:hypothetical protein